MKKKIRSALALTLVVAAACGDDSSDDTNGGTDAGSLTLQDALKTDGTNTSAQRAALLIPIACEHSQDCLPDPDCVAGYTTEYQRGLDSQYDDACLDSTLDLFACFASEKDCTKFNSVCSSLSDRSKSLCANYADAGLPMLRMP